MYLRLFQFYFQTAEAILDFNKESLPLVIFANWRGFSGGQKGFLIFILHWMDLKILGF